MPAESLLRRSFSLGRFFGGILTLILTCGLIAGCAYTSGHGIWYLVIALPGFGIGFGLIAKPWRYECARCNSPLKLGDAMVPFDISALPHAHQVAVTGNAGMLDSMIRSAPLASPPRFCGISARACRACGEVGQLRLLTYTVSRTFRSPVAEKEPVEFGAEVGPDVLALIERGDETRWPHVTATTGIVRAVHARPPDGNAPAPARGPVQYAPPVATPVVQDVMVLGPDGRGYAGRVIGRSPGQVQVAFANGSSAWMPEASVRPGARGT